MNIRNLAAAIVVANALAISTTAEGRASELEPVCDVEMSGHVECCTQLWYDNAAQTSYTNERIDYYEEYYAEWSYYCYPPYDGYCQQLTNFLVAGEEELQMEYGAVCWYADQWGDSMCEGEGGTTQIPALAAANCS